MSLRANNPVAGEWWVTAAGFVGEGQRIQIVGVHRHIPHRPLVTYRVAGVQRDLRIPLDNRWGRGLVRCDP